MRLYHNTGAPFVRETGDWIQRDEIFVPTAVEIVQYSYKLEPALQELRRRWPTTMTPALYLRLSPVGKHAELARQIVAEER